MDLCERENRRIALFIESFDVSHHTKTENDAFQVDFRSENVATMDKESEARRHLETLFDYWKNKSIERKK